MLYIRANRMPRNVLPVHFGIRFWIFPKRMPDPDSHTIVFAVKGRVREKVLPFPIPGLFTSARPLWTSAT